MLKYLIHHYIFKKPVNNNIESTCPNSCNQRADTELSNQNGLKTIEPIKTIEELLKQEQERNAQLESTIYSLTSELKSYESLVAQIISGGSKVRKKLSEIDHREEKA